MAETKPLTGSSAEHARLSASGAHRWMRCPGAPNASDLYPEEETSTYAMEGTAAHELAARALQAGPKSKRKIAKQNPHILAYVDYVLGIAKKADSNPIIELRVDYSDWVPDGFGTGDCLILDDDTAHVIDLKYGQGVKVFAEENEQLQLYALGMIPLMENFFAPKKFKLHIFQPRLDHIDTWEVSFEDLLAFGETAKLAATLTCDPDALRIPGRKQCRWCPHKLNCPELLAQTEELTRPAFQNLDTLTHAVDHEIKVRILRNKKLIMDVLHSLEAEALSELQMGHAYPGFRLGKGQSRAQWSDKAEGYLVKALGDEAWKKSLITITEAKKLLPKSTVDTLTFKPEGKPVLVPEPYQIDDADERVISPFKALGAPDYDEPDGAD